MMAARLRYLIHDIAMPAGSFVIGRGPECQLALDDSLVSRRHAVIRVESKGTFLEDLGSRNGVFLNGVRLERLEPLHDGDQIRIGSQDLGFFDDEETGLHPVSSKSDARVTRREMRRVDLMKEVDSDDPGERTIVGAGPTAVQQARTSGLAIIGSVADKALALGRAEEAERILQRSLADILLRAQTAASTPEPPATESARSAGVATGAPSSIRGVDPDIAETAAGYAVRVAAATGRGVWIDYVFQLYTALGALLPARLVDELYAAVRKVKHTDKSVLRAYTACLRDVSSSFGPAERFVLQRIEGFERWAP